jgi:DNA-binding GntR family transcriptional regulator
MSIQRASPSEQIANALRAEIEDGTLKPGQPLPSDAELAARFGVSAPTASKARAMLVALGLVSSRSGAASTVCAQGLRPISPDTHVRRARRTGRIYPEGHYARIVHAGLVPASSAIAAALSSDPGSSVIERRRITHAADDTPLAASTTYFPATLLEQCPALVTTERIKQGTTLYIEEQTGRTAATIDASVVCAPGGTGPDSDAAKLQLSPDSYVLVLSTTTYDTHGVVLAYEIELHPPATPIILGPIGL